ncbi:hypothetical protein MIND_00513400 [Mycena indigotica]|uniref:Uncharacterized protein n=1 Tax=Mycena indigotica TaxID=2126181 RepID=A0A8H6SWG5_9AGAR|nr:uncharacterized protein MIND_00513400 [Mycena indigotica]KAF7307198.1 hypothetical protein MIND_00513400 [Mycena indigotica]
MSATSKMFSLAVLEWLLDRLQAHTKLEYLMLSDILVTQNSLAQSLVAAPELLLSRVKVQIGDGVLSSSKPLPPPSTRPLAKLEVAEYSNSPRLCTLFGRPDFEHYLQFVQDLQIYAYCQEQLSPCFVAASMLERLSCEFHYLFEERVRLPACLPRLRELSLEINSLSPFIPRLLSEGSLPVLLNLQIRLRVTSHALRDMDNEFHSPSGHWQVLPELDDALIAHPTVKKFVLTLMGDTSWPEEEDKIGYPGLMTVASSKLAVNLNPNSALEGVLDFFFRSLSIPLQPHQIREMSLKIPPEVAIHHLVQCINELEKTQKDTLHDIRITIHKDTLRYQQFMANGAQAAAATIISFIERPIADRANLVQAETGLHHVGAATFADNQGNAKQGDNGFLPQNTRRFDWPTVVVRVGYNQSLPSLYQDVDEWFTMSADHRFPVKLVILIKLFDKTQQMRVEFLERASVPNPTLPYHASRVPGLGPYEWDQASISTTNPSAMPKWDIPLHLIYDNIPNFLTGPSLVRVNCQIVYEWVGSVLQEL